MGENNNPFQSDQKTRETATLGGGCFWCLDPIFASLKGIEQVESGYTGGKIPNPTYQQVCHGTTGHAEVVQLTFNPKIISFKEILEIFFAIHNPTTLNRQGADTGTQYRSAIFYHTDEQKKISEEVFKEINSARIWTAPLVTEITPLTTFYRAEDYHQEYFKNNPAQPYCLAVISPKMAKFSKHYLSKLKT
ncbi:MAG: peptide-methionine (S)-S-oxide reductase MsrA [Nitrospirae bacterium]|nr:peptide-methionine (S)-S-oxide reductase MsrA [Nitrospirota bacterium]